MHVPNSLYEQPRFLFGMRCIRLLKLAFGLLQTPNNSDLFDLIIKMDVLLCLENGFSNVTSNASRGEIFE
jgi:hypothetical protein